jgi:energy-converting hydrogenase B subunit D
VIVLQAILFVLVGIGSVAVALTRKPEVQLIVFSAYGSVLAFLFAALQAPDVALSEIAVGTLVLPFMLFITLAKMRDPKA